MEKTTIDLEVLLPEVPDERDDCVNRIIDNVERRNGVKRVHIVSSEKEPRAQLCFHYDPDIISIKQVENAAKTAGAEITSQYGHLFLQVEGVRQPRHARQLESKLADMKGMTNVSVSGTGFIQAEYVKTALSREQVLDKVKALNLIVIKAEDRHTHNLSDDKHTHKHDDDSHDHKGDKHDHDHAVDGWFGERTELIFSIICGAFLALGFGVSFISNIPFWVPLALYVVSYFFGGYYTTKEAISGIRNGEFEIDFLMLVAAIGAAALGQFAEGALLLFLFSLGHSLEHFAMEKARKSIAALTKLTPKTALLKTGNSFTEVPIEQLKPGDIIVVKPNLAIAADGVVTKGNSSVNQAPITGESVPVDKQPFEGEVDFTKADKLDAKFRVFAGSLNGGSSLEVMVTKPAEDSTISRLVKLVNEAQTQKSATQNFTDKLEKYYVPLVLGMVFILLFSFLVIDEPFSDSFYRAMAVLVAASPCALAISTPSAVLSGVARAAREGVLIKGGKALEALGTLTAIAFDKTGTLTEGKPRLTGIYPLNGIAEDRLLEVVIAVEQLSDHPVAAALVKGAKEKLNREVTPATGVKGIVGRGVEAKLNGQQVFIGNKELFEGNEAAESSGAIKRAKELEAEGNTTMIVQEGEEFLGIVTLLDEAKPDAKPAITRLPEKGIKKMIMLTGDNQDVANAIARQTGITEAWGNLLPEQKMDAIEKLKASEKGIAMVGDGVNDAPAMAKSTVGIAMGAAGSDVALETADVALMANELIKLPFAIGLSKQAKTIINQNLVISLGMVVVLVPLTMLGIAHMGPAVIGHEGSTLLVVFNALRLLAYKDK